MGGACRVGLREEHVGGVCSMGLREGHVGSEAMAVTYGGYKNGGKVQVMCWASRCKGW